MPIPDFQTLMLPVLKFYSDGEEKSLRDAVQAMSVEFGITEEESNAKIPSGKQPIFYNRVGWARTYLKQARLLTLPGIHRLPRAGRRCGQGAQGHKRRHADRRGVSG
jgi:restriction system protein